MLSGMDSLLSGLDLPYTTILVVGFAVCVGSIVQGSTGFGVSLIAVPVVTLLDPTLMPGSMLMVGTLLPLFTLGREHRHIDWPVGGLTIIGRLLGTGGGVLALVLMTPRSLEFAIGFLVLAGVLLSVRNVVLPMNRGSLFGAGVVTGVTGTATSISGPVIGLALQRMSGPPMRATMAVFFCVGTIFSLGGLALAGHLPTRQVVMGLAMVPFLASGYALSGPLRRFLDTGWTRPAVLTICTVSAVVVLLKATLGST